MKYIILLLLLAIFTIQSCRQLWCDDCFGQECSNPNYDAGFAFRMIDENNQNLVAAYRAKYNIDSVELTKEDGTIPFQYGKSPDGHIGFSNPPEDEILVDTNYIRQYYLYFPAVGTTPKDKDTITLHYFAQGRCLEGRLIVSYNDSLYRDAPYANSVGIRFVKK